MKSKISRKAPCRVCGKWFVPNPRLGKRQKTCGDPVCKRKWHAKMCAEWNKKHPQYFREIYLDAKIAAAQDILKESNDSTDKKINSPPFKPLTKLKLPRIYVQDVIGVKSLVIIEYFEQLLLKHVQEVMIT